MGYHVRVKICGVTNLDDWRACLNLGVDALGLNFHPPSPRSISPEQARSLLRELPPFVDAVGVFVQTPLASLRTTLDSLGRIRTVQIHGHEPEGIDAFPYRYVPAFQIKDKEDLQRMKNYLTSCAARECLPSAVLLDGHAPGLVGGTGRCAPWTLLQDLSLPVPVILAGGLTPDNVAEAVQRVRPWAVDVASGVESSPGRKDLEKVRRFLDQAREAAWRC